MSWIRDHFYEFVFPAFLAAEKEVTEIGAPFDVKISPHAPEKMPAVLRKLWTLCRGYDVPWSWDVREGGGSSKFRDSATLHQQVLRATLDSAMVALREEKCSRLLLGGRDVWTFAVLCNRRKIPHLFVPELSRKVAESPHVKPFLEERGFTGDELFLDTGFVGSIPRVLSSHFQQPFKFRLMSQSRISPPVGAAPHDLPAHGSLLKKVSRKHNYPNQLFPNRKSARTEALNTEYLAKYWKTGTVKFDAGEMNLHELMEALPLLQRHPVLMRVVTKEAFFLYDGETFVRVVDPYVYPTALGKWWDKLPMGPANAQPRAYVTQYFSDRSMIQRAALLTAQLWYGIPYWKPSALAEAKASEGPWTSADQTKLMKATLLQQAHQQAQKHHAMQKYVMKQQAWLQHTNSASTTAATNASTVTNAWADLPSAIYAYATTKL